ncbi:hypothetical protein [Ohtaekwangia koreensis]|nr:hypothetical protein [Ohtaekwangia koreensis]
MQKKMEDHLRQKYAPGFYAGTTICNEILKFIFEFYEEGLNRLLPNIATSRWVGEILFQNEEAGKASRAFKLGELADDDSNYWQETGPKIQQSLDLICEKLAEIGETDKVSGLWQTQIPDFENVLLCAEKCVEYANVSNHTFMVAPNATSIKINAVGEDPYFEHVVDDLNHDLMADYHRQNRKEVTLREQYLEKSFDPFDHQYHAKVLNEPFCKVFGITYTEFQALVTAAPANMEKIESHKKAPMCLKDHLLTNLAAYYGFPFESVNAVINNLILDKSIPRQVWNSRQYNRINKRPFLEFQSKGRTVIMWSHKKVEDYLTLLDSELAFNKTPHGWKHKPLTDAISEIARNAGKWFERSVIAQLEKLGFSGRSIKDKTFNKFPDIKFECGEIDYLGYHAATKCLAIFEFKFFETGFDARGIRQVKSAFLEGDDAYVPIFEKKIAWINNNLSFIKSYFEAEHHIQIPCNLHDLKSTFITYYPTPLNLFFLNPRCKSLVQFVEDFQTKELWPY